MLAELRPYLEIIYFITGGPVLAIFAYLALKQITVAKEIARISSKREAYRIAVEQVRFYVDDILPLINQFNKKIAANKAESLLDAKVIIKNGSVNVERSKVSANDDSFNKFKSVVTEFADMVNRFEAFSIVFVSGVGDESIAYSSVGQTFVKTITGIMPILIIQANSGSYESLFKLLHLWHSRLEKEKLEKQSESIKSELAAINSSVITPVGTD